MSAGEGRCCWRPEVNWNSWQTDRTDSSDCHLTSILTLVLASFLDTEHPPQIHVFINVKFWTSVAYVSVCIHMNYLLSHCGKCFSFFFLLFQKMLKTTTIKMSGRHNSFRLKFLDHCNRWSKKLERRLEGRQEGEAVFSVSSVSLWNFNNGVWAPIFRVCLPLQPLLLSLSYTHAHMDTCS